MWLRGRAVQDRIVVVIADDGPGLPSGVDPMARGMRGPTSTGHGLGLYITADLVRRSGGTVRLESKRGTGCTVVIEIPKADVSTSQPVVV